MNKMFIKLMKVSYEEDRVLSNELINENKADILISKILEREEHNQQ